MQGHALTVRQSGGVLPCPLVDFTGGFNAFFGAAFGLGERSIADVYGSPFGMLSVLPGCFLFCLVFCIVGPFIVLLHPLYIL